MTNDERFRAALERLRESYNPPPKTPREEMWGAIQAGLEEARDSSVVSIERSARWSHRRRIVGWAIGSVAAAALLVIGIGIGRISTAPEAAVVAETGAAPDATGELRPRARGAAAFRHAAVAHLLASEPLLTMVRNDADAGRFDASLGEWARDLLTQTRLLLDSPAADDPAMGELLEDLELILVQLARLEGEQGTAGRGSEELDLIARGMDRQEMLLRIQTVAPAGSTLAGA